MTGIWIYDIETLSNLFTYVAKNRDTGEIFTQYIWDEDEYRHANLKALQKHIWKCTGMVGYNNLNFDYPVIDYLLKADLGELPASKLYDKAQEVISTKYPAIRNPSIRQLDLFKLWHFDNKAKITSLKKLQIAMKWDNVADMPIHHSETITTKEQVQEVMSYNINDVLSTEKFYELSEDKIGLRREIENKYGLKCVNYSDSKIGESLMLHLYSNAVNIPSSTLKNMRTNRNTFSFKDCIPSHINFQTSEFNELLTYLRGIEVTELKDSFKYSFEYDNFTYELGTGGIHGCIKPNVYESDDEYLIVDADVASLYPSIAIVNGYYPEHLGEEFAKVYEEGIVKPRLKAKKEGDKTMANGLKLAANSVYGKSNSRFSWLYDPLYTLKTTITGQLDLCMLGEMLATGVRDLTMLQINTDGLTVKIPRSERRRMYEICQEWERITNLILEYVPYSKMIIRDVNNYIAVSTEGKVKRKGAAFKLNSEIIRDGEYHKPLNQGVVKDAVSKYFLNLVPVEESIRQCKDVLMFTKTFNATKGWTANLFTEYQLIPQQKTNRYVITTDGMGFKKVHDDGREIEIEAGRKVAILNNLSTTPLDLSVIDYDYYIEEAYKIIHKIDGTEEAELLKKKAEKELLKREKEEANWMKYCWNKPPTKRQLILYGKDWLLEKYGTPKTKEELNS